MSKTKKSKCKAYYWVTADGRKLRLSEMETSHLRNAIQWCERQVVRCRLTHFWDEGADDCYEVVVYKDVEDALAHVAWSDPRMFKHNTGKTYKAMKRELRARMQ